MSVFSERSLTGATSGGKIGAFGTVGVGVGFAVGAPGVGVVGSPSESGPGIQPEITLLEWRVLRFSNGVGSVAGLAGVLAGSLVGTVPVAADPITNRDFAIDFYDGVAIGSSKQVGMGGAGAALLVGSAGSLLNAAAPVIRETTDTGTWSWDYHFDVLSGRYSTDYDNNGYVAPEASGATLATIGASLRVNNWAIAFTTIGQTTHVGESPGASRLEAEALRVRGVFAYYFENRDLAVGLGFQTVTFRLGPQDDPMFQIDGAGVIAGATWMPRFTSVRIGAALESSILGGNVDAASCDPENCMGYILPSNIESPARTIVGGAYRFAPTAWNQLVGGRFRDERSLTIATDVVVVGRSTNGHGIEAFGMQELQRSGRRIGVSIRGGAEFEWLPGRLRLRAGSYWEPERFDGIGGRLHATFGADLRVFEFDLYGVRRGRIGATGDIASRYRNIAVSVGFWH